MKNEQSFEKEMREFVQLMYQKGYSGRFLLDAVEQNGIMTAADLKGCLETFLKIYGKTNGKNPLLRLETDAPHNDDLRCIFNVAFKELEGFKIRKMEIVNVRNNEHKVYNITHNNQIPGSQAVLGLFPKPKPWHKHLKGRRPF